MVSELFKRSVLILIAVAMLVTGLRGSTAPVEAQVVLNVWVMPSGLDLPRRIDVETVNFNLANPGGGVNIITIPWTQAYEEIQRAIRGEVPTPDVLQIGTTWIDSIAAQGVLHTFTDEQITAVGGPGAFLDNTWQAGIADVDGTQQVIGLPWFNETRAVIYRTDIFNETGLNPDEVFSSWENFMAAIQAIENADYFIPNRDGPPQAVYPIMISGQPGTNAVHDFAPWVWNAGGSFLDESGTQAMLTSGPTLDGIRFYTNFYTGGFTEPIAPQLSSSDADFFFLARRSAMIVSGPWAVQRVRTTGLVNDIAVAQLPAGPSGGDTFIGGSAVAVWRDNRDLERSVALAQYLASAESQERFTSSAGLLPTRLELLDGFRQDPFYSVYVAATENSRTYPQVTYWAPVEELLSDGFERLWDSLEGVSDPAAADAILLEQLAALEAEANAALAELSAGQ